MSHTIYNRLMNFNINYEHYAHVLKAKQYHDGIIKIAPRVKTVIAHKIGNKWTFLTQQK